MNNVESNLDVSGEKQISKETIDSRENELTREMLTLTYQRDAPTRFEYRTSDDRRVAIWFDVKGQLSDSYNHERFDTDLQEGYLPLIPEEANENEEIAIKGLSSLFAHELGTPVKINDTWFDANGIESDDFNSYRFQEDIEKLPLEKIT